MKKKLLGLGLILLGLILGADKLEIIDISKIFFDGWWTLAIILPCVFGIFNKKLSTLSIFGLLTGLAMLAKEQHLISSIGGLLLPIFLLTVGIEIIFSKNKKVEINKIDDNYLALFGKVEKKVDVNENINSGAIFGDLELDLSNIKLDKDIVINTKAIFGRTEVKLPENVKLILNKQATVLGSCNSLYVNSDKQKAHSVIINAITVFGATELK